MFWKQKLDPVETCGHTLYEVLANSLTKDGRIHVEDLISAAAAVVGEAAIGAAGDFDPLKHDFAPGSRVFSTKVNEIFCGDTDLDNAPVTSIVGLIFKKLMGCGFKRSDFPELKDIFSYYAANIGKGGDWGKVPLSVPKDNHPFIIPLRAAYELRMRVDKALAPLGQNQQQKLTAASLALAESLCQTRDALDRRIAITLAFETANGMAKTAPMTDEAMAKLKADQKT